MNNTYNIPTVSTNTVIEQLTALYASAIENDMLACIPSVSLWGSMGIGKSSAVYQIGENLTKQLKRNVKVTEIRLLNFSPVDLRGVPVVDAQREFTIWLKPKIFDLKEEDINILFLDELSSAPTSLQASAYQIALDKKVGEFELPKDTIVICAGNRTTDRSVAFRMPKALANRFLHFEVEANFDSWYAWAVEHDIHESVLGYLSFAQNKLDMEPDLEELSFPTPRSWQFVSMLLKSTNKSPKKLHDLIGGTIGVSNAIEFEQWCKVYKSLPKIEDIVSGSYKKTINQVDVLHALNASLLSYVSKHKNLSNVELENICRYVSNFPTDFSALFFRGILKIEGMNVKFSSIPTFLAWMKKNKRYL